MNYNQYNDPFSNTEFIELDKEARKIADKRKSVYKDVKKTNKNFDKETLKGIDAYYGDPTFSFLPMDNNYFKKKGDFISGLPTVFENSDNESKSDDFSSSISSDRLSQMHDSNPYKIKNKNKKDVKNFSDNILSDCGSLSFSGNFSDTDLSSGYSSLPKKHKSHLRLNTDHLKKYKDHDDKNILNHIKTCTECKTQLLELLKENNHVFSNSYKNDLNMSIQDNDSFFGLNYKEFKNVLILIIIGIIIIVVIDLFLRK